MASKISVALSTDHLTTSVSPEEGIYLHLPDVSGLDSLPQCGEITFKFRRKELSLVTREDNRLSADLCLLEITQVEEDKSCPEEKTDDVVDKLFADAKKAPDEEEGEDN